MSDDDPKITEGDVETQRVIPLLTDPHLLGHRLADIRSKTYLPPRDIGKGNKRRIGYVPDFLIYIESLPTVVVEAKAPGANVEAAYAEARLYATEINSGYPTGINPCYIVIATNGERVLAGNWDAEATFDKSLADILPSSANNEDLRAIASYEQAHRNSRSLVSRLKSTTFKRPFNRGEGQAQIISKLEPNTFAADLAPILRKYFSSREQNSDPEIYGRAYISSDEVTSYDRILESFLRDRLSRSKSRKTLKTTKKRSDAFTKQIEKFDSDRPTKGDLQLITGGVGAGKSLFARRYKEYLQPGNLKKRNHWAFLDFNNAPADFSRINDWVCETFVKSVIEEGAPLDLRDGDDQERVFASAIADRQAYYTRMERIAPGRGALELARDIEQWRVDPHKLTLGISRYLQGDRSENLIVVFDNVDRRDSETQLTAFQTALWFMDQTHALVLLQMRDSTFEAYKLEPPLDTYRSGQIFHIAPPRFIDVVKRRLELSLEALSKEAPEQITFTTSKGVKISYPKSRAGEFMRGIYLNLFAKPTNVSRILEALAGRDVRRALDMFFAIITSGHMPEEMIASVAQGQGMSHFPEYRILRALMRQDYRFYNEHSGFVANIFWTNSRWKLPNNFLISEILFYTIGRRKILGDNNQLGYVALPRLTSHLQSFGFIESDIYDAVRYCLDRALIEAETQSIESIGPRDCIKASASGWAHLRILSGRLEYLSSVLAITPMDDRALRERVFAVMQTEHRLGHPSFGQSYPLVHLFEAYLQKQFALLKSNPGYKDAPQSGARYVLEKVREALHHSAGQSAAPGQGDWLDI